MVCSEEEGADAVAVLSQLRVSDERRLREESSEDRGEGAGGGGGDREDRREPAVSEREREDEAQAGTDRDSRALFRSAMHEGSNPCSS